MNMTNLPLSKMIPVSVLSLGLSLAISQPARAQATHIAHDWAQATTGYDNDSLRDFSARLLAALDQAGKSPEQKQPVTFSASVTAEGRTGIRHLRIRDFQFLSDGAVNAGEYNLGAGSWPSLVGVLGGAVAQDFLIQAAIKGIPLDSLEVIFTSTPGPAPSWTGKTITYPRDLAYTAYIVSPASDAELEDLRKTVERESAVLTLVREKQDIPHAEIIYTQTPKDRPALAGLREYLDGKRQASRRPVRAEGAAPVAAAQPAADTNPPAGGRRRRNAATLVGAPDSTQGGGANENAPLRADIKVEGSTGIRDIRTDTSNFQFIHDFPRYLGGHNLGPVAEEHILGVMITCLTHIFELQATSKGVDLDSLRLEVEGTLTSRVGSTDQSPRFSNLHYRAYIGSPESKETVAALVEGVEGVCSIYNLLRNANDISGKVLRGPYREPVRTTVAQNTP